MAGKGLFASGKYSLAICDGCGFQFRYLDLMLESQTGLYKCPDCGIDPPEGRRYVPTDRVALHHARPETVTFVSSLPRTADTTIVPVSTTVLTADASP